MTQHFNSLCHVKVFSFFFFLHITYDSFSCQMSLEKSLSNIVTQTNKLVVLIFFVVVVLYLLSGSR